MLLKIVGMITIFGVCSATGLLKSSTLSKRVRQLEVLKGAVGLIATEIRYFASPVDVLMTKLSALSEYDDLRIFGLCAKNLSRCSDFQKAWGDALRDAKPSLALDKGDYETLKWFGDALGTTDIQGQIANCERTMELLTQRLSHAREDKTRRGKMYTSLGILTGAFFIVIFL